MYRLIGIGPQTVWKILSDGNWVMMPNECEKLSDGWWVMIDEWWVMEIEWLKKWSQTGWPVFVTQFSVFITHNSKMVGPIAKRLFGKR